jgi:NAD-dependent dihydropyrimidine dehydrogenase PreA subunit
VIVTANFRLTVRRVRRSIRNHDLWLLVVNTKGINVWCAACGGLFTHNRVIDMVKFTQLDRVVDHRQLILPALSAPGVDAEAVRDATSFAVQFGPVRAEDISAYLGNRTKTEAMRRFRFGLKHRIDMYLSMNLLVYLPIAALLSAFWTRVLPGFTLLFWPAVAFLYLCLDIIPGKSGWAQALFSAGLWAVGWAGFDWVMQGNPLAHWPWLVALVGIFLLAGIDLAGTVSPRRSDFELLLHRVGEGRLGSLVSARDLGAVSLDRGACGGCGQCEELCPVGVFGLLDHERKTTFRDRGACFACAACVRQCPGNALSLAADGSSDRDHYAE